MAKGNLLLGTAKNSVGDVVMYRREGAQITRVRVRNVKNPKTYAQSFQRAIMAPIAKFYSPLSVVLERSFEGLSKAKSHNKFNQVNANLARKNKWALPKGTGFFPLPYQLSQGTLPPVEYRHDADESVFSVSGIGGITDKTTMGGLSQFFVGAGYNNGDVVTIIMACIGANNSYYPVSYQFEIDTTSTVTIAAALPDLTVTINPDGSSSLYISGTTLSAEGFAVIVSRFDGTMWRRSTQSLVVTEFVMSSVTTEAAIAAAIASYGQTAGDGNPLVYLDGDELEDRE